MDIMELGAIGELVGGVAVVATLIYLAVQVRQNTHALSSGRHVDSLRYGQAAVTRFIEDKNFANFILDAQRTPGDLDPTDWERFVYFAFQVFTTWEVAYLDFRRGLLGEEYWRGWDGSSRRFLDSAGYIRFWQEQRAGFAPEFQRYVDEQISQPGAEA